MDQMYFRVFYPMPPNDYHPGLIEIAKYLIWHKPDWGLVMLREFKTERYELVVPFDSLSMVSDRLPRKSEGRTFKKELIPGRIPICQRCGCYYITLRASGFRGIDGVASKVIECPFCYRLGNEAALATSDVYRERGVLAALEFQKETLMTGSEFLIWEKD